MKTKRLLTATLNLYQTLEADEAMTHSDIRSYFRGQIMHVGDPDVRRRLYDMIDVLARLDSACRMRRVNQ